MKIAIIANPNFKIPPERYGGTELMVNVLTEGLVSRNHEVYLYASGDSETKAILKSTFEKSLTSDKGSENIFLEQHHYSKAVSDIARSGDFDIVHFNGGAYALPFTNFLSETIPCFYSLHFTNRAQDQLLRYYQDIHYIALSESQRSLQKELNNVHLIYHGLDTTPFTINLKPSNYVAWLGRIARPKGTHTAISAALKAGLKIKLGGLVKPYWTDNTYFSRSVRPLINSNPNDVEFLGNLNLPEKVELLSGAKAMLFPIIWNEPFGLVMIESMFCGTPVVAFRKGSVPEIVEEGVTGFIVKNEDEMASILTSDKISNFDRKKCAERARARFNISTYLDNHEKLYKEIIQRKEVKHGN